MNSSDWYSYSDSGSSGGNLTIDGIYIGPPHRIIPKVDSTTTEQTKGGFLGKLVTSSDIYRRFVSL